MHRFPPRLFAVTMGVRAIAAASLIAVILAFAGGKPARAQNLQWANRVANAGFFPGASVALDKNGNVFATSVAIVSDTSAISIHDVRTIKYDGQGRTLWTAAYRSEFTTNVNGRSINLSTPHALRVGASGDVYLSAQAESANGYGDVVVLKYNGATGAKMWEQRINGADDRTETNSYLVLDASDNSYLACQSGAVATGNDWLLAKHDKNGVQQWRVTANPGGGIADDRIAGLSINYAGTALAVTSDEISGNRVETAKYATASGVQQWIAYYPSPDPSGANHASVTAIGLDGNVYMAGHEPRVGGNPGATNALVIKYNGATGAQMWKALYNGLYDTTSESAMLLDTAGNVILAGGSISYANGVQTLFLLRLNAANGATLWHNDNEAGTPNGPLPNALGLDAAGNLYTTSLSPAPAFSPYHIFTRKYAATTGVKLWENYYETPSSKNDLIGALVADASGNVFVTGSVLKADDKVESLTFKLAAYKYTATDAAVGGGDGKTRLLFTTRDNATFQLWRIGTTGVAEVKKTFAPPAKFAPVAITCGPDNKTRVLMTRSTDAVSYTAVFTADLSLQSSSFVMNPPQSGTVAFDLAVSKTNQSLIAWKRSAGVADNRLYSQTVMGDMTLAATYAYGPYANLVPLALSTSLGDGKTRVLWRNGATQQIVTWVLKADASAAESGKYYPIPSGYDIRDMSASGSDDTTSLLWADTTGRLALWRLNPAQSAIVFSKVYGPYIGLSGRKIAVSPTDNKVRLLWNDTTGKTVLWTIGATGTIEAGYTYPAF